MSGERKSKLPVIELVTHCYATKMPQYAAALRFQLSSLVFYQPANCRLIVTVCFNPKDKATRHVFDQFSEDIAPQGVEFKSIQLSVGNLGRRCIGRNMAALESEADLVWFTDVDHVFLPPCFDELIALTWPEDAVMVYPKHIMIQKDHYLGDEYLTREPRHCILEWVDRNDFMPKTYDRPVGGVQIVKGNTARKHGYLNGQDKWMVPCKNPFGDFRDDVRFRKTMKGIGMVRPVEFSGVFRLRHTETTYYTRQPLVERGANG